jgi:hypothetical protein
MRRLILPVIVALALAPTCVQAQLDSPTSPHAVLQLADRQDWLVRVTSSSGATIEGGVQELDADAVRLDGGRIALSDVARVDRGEQVGEGARTGAIAGGIIVATVFLVTAYAISDDSEFDVEDSGPLAVAGIVAGAILGGLIGADLDPARTEWQQLWPVGGW